MLHSTRILAIAIVFFSTMGHSSAGILGDFFKTFNWEISGNIQCGVHNPETGEIKYSNYSGATVGLWELDREFIFYKLKITFLDLVF